MSYAAWKKNCLVCPYRTEMYRGRLDLRDMPCPTVIPPNRKQEIKLTPGRVSQRMPKTWVCPERKA